MVAYAKPVSVNAFTCPKCKQTVYARCEHDLHTCFCSSVDCHGRLTNMAEKNGVSSCDSVSLTIDASQEELSADFYYNGGHYGTIQPHK